MKAWFGLLQDVKVVDLNRLLKSHGVRLVVKKSKDWGKNVSVTAHAVGTPAKRSRGVRVAPAPAGSTVPPVNMADDGPGGPLG